jgi:error-prone DNA polymerase
VGHVGAGASGGGGAPARLPRIALTDTDNLYGLWPFLQACREEGVTPIVGAEAQRAGLAPSRGLFGRKRRRLSQPVPAHHAQALQEGLFAGKRPSRLSAGLYVLVPGADLLAPLHEAGVTVAAALPRRPSPSAAKARAEARRLGVPAVAVPSSFFLVPGDHELHRLLRAIARNTSLSRLKPSRAGGAGLCPAQPGRARPSEARGGQGWVQEPRAWKPSQGFPVNDVAPTDAWLAPPAHYERRFDIWPETLAASDEIAERLTFTDPNLGLVMPPWREDVGQPSHEILRERCYAGARKRYGAELHETVVDRIEYELATIERMGFSSYFLVVEEIVKRSPRICGRGSGAASIVAYSLGITNVCPVKFNLYFERFLNPGRKDPPDIDVDFAWDERDAAIASVLDEFRDHSAMVACFANFQPRMAIRETAKVFGLTDAEIGQVSKRLPWFWREVGNDDDDLIERLRDLPELKDLDFPEPWPEILQLAQRLIGIPRHISVHPGGVVITPEPLDGYVPIEIAPKGVPVIQWEKDSTETAGLVKIDLLGNRSLAVIRDAVANVQANGTSFDEARWEPEDDPATQASIAAGATMGCFYIESPATRLLQQKARRGDYEHVVIHSSIIRPAANKWIHEYLRRLHGGAWQPIHPLLDGVLDDNYGIMVYQEDVAKAAMALAGFNHVEADGLRKVMSKKDRAKRLPDYLRRFIAGARSRGVSTEQIEAVWEMILSFDGYSFCKPHSASYARVSFQAAYLKTHFPAEFMAAVISNQGGFYSTSAYVSETRRLGVRVLPPDVNHSEILWTGNSRAERRASLDADHRGFGEAERSEGEAGRVGRCRGRSEPSQGSHVNAGAVRVGWLTLHHLGAETRGRIVAQRPYRDVVDFLERVRPDEEEARVLVHARAFDGLSSGLHPTESHAAQLWQIAAWRKSTAGRKSHDLFTRSATIPRPSLAPDDPQARLHAEMKALGFLCDVHPMVLCESAVARQHLVKAKALSRFVGRRVRCAGFLVTGKVVSTLQGDPMEFITFEDETGLMECTFFPETYRRFCHMLDHQRPYFIEGKVEEDYGAFTITVDAVSRIEFNNEQPKLAEVEQELWESGARQPGSEGWG